MNTVNHFVWAILILECMGMMFVVLTPKKTKASFFTALARSLLCALPLGHGAALFFANLFQWTVWGHVAWGTYVAFWLAFFFGTKEDVPSSNLPHVSSVFSSAMIFTLAYSVMYAQRGG